MKDDFRRTCRAFYQVLSDYLDGRLPEEDEDYVREHLEACPP